MAVSIENLKSEIRQRLQPALPYLLNKGIYPNKISIGLLCGSILFGIIIPAFALVHIVFLFLFPIWCAVRVGFGIIEDIMSKECDLNPPERIVLNELTNVISDLAMYFPLIILVPQALPSIFFFAIGSVIIEFCGLLGLLNGSNRRCDGPMGKNNRIIYVCTLIVPGVFFPGLISYWNIMFLPGIILMVLTCRNRIAGAIQGINSPDGAKKTVSE